MSMRSVLMVFISLFFVCLVQAQIPGQIVRRSTVNTVLDPTPSSGFISTSTRGFVSSDITESRLPFRVMPLPFSEPIGDLATGQSGSFTDLVTSPIDKSGLMVYFDNNNNLIFRLRLGSISSGAKGYSILIDADNRAGNSGPQADPNYIAPTAQGTGNIGFEWEVLLATGNATTVSLFETDGKNGSNIVRVNQVTNNNFQISRALTNNSSHGDYFFDFYVPLSWFSGTHAITAATRFRIVSTTVNSPTSALAGSRSDIYGADDRNYSSTPEEWLAVLGGTPPVTLAQLNSGTIGGICTAPPVITTASIPITTGTNTTSVSGTWARRDDTMDDKAIITLYRFNSAGTQIGTYTSGVVNTGTTWTISGVQASAGDYFFARAKGTSTVFNESECMQSDVIYAACVSAPAVPTINCASTKGITGTIPSGATVEIYEVRTTDAGVTTTPLTTNLLYTNNTSDRTFNYYGTNSTSGSACGGNTNLFTIGTTLLFVTNLNGCKSADLYGCITGSNTNSNLSLTTSNTNDLVFTTPVYPFNSTVTGTSTTGFTTGQVLRLLVNGVYRTGYTVTAATNNFSFSGVNLRVNDKLRVVRQTSGSCMSISAEATVVCFTQPPVINIPNGGLQAGSSQTISGTATPGATITLNRNNATTPSNQVTTDANGRWSVTGLTLASNDTYTATATVNGCASTATAPVTVVAAPPVVCPVVNNISEGATVITGTVNNAAAGMGTVTLYQDGDLLGTVAVSTTGSAVGWSFTLPAGVGPLYADGVVNATYRIGSGAEYWGCDRNGTSYRTVSCAALRTPTITPQNTTITVNNSVSYTISNLENDAWYTIDDRMGTRFYGQAQQFTGAGSSISITTEAFPQAGTFNLRVAADKLLGCPISQVLSTVTVNDQVLPVKFLSFEAAAHGNTVPMKWRVAEEVSVAFYQVERSTNGVQFTPVAKVAYKPVSAGAENEYRFVDVAAPVGIVYYRIRQVDLDGRFTLSTIKSVQIREAVNAVLVYPNPLQAQSVLQVEALQAQTLQVQISNMLGSRLARHSFRAVKGRNLIPLQYLKRLPAGQYLLTVVVDGKQYQVKLVK